MEKVNLGIDLGMAYSCMSYVDDKGVIRIIDNLEGNTTTPSIVFFYPDLDYCSVGEDARKDGLIYPELLCERVKEHMSDPDYRFSVNGTEFSAAAISSIILNKLIKDAEFAFGEEKKIGSVVITMPSYYGCYARAAINEASEGVTLQNGEKLKVAWFAIEPIAATIAYSWEKAIDKPQTVLVYDLGATFDCSVVRIDSDTYRIVTANGNRYLGGKDWDAALEELFRDKFCQATGADPDAMREDPEYKKWCSQNIERAKKAFAFRKSIYLAPSFDGMKERIEITLEEFEDVTAGLLNETIMLVNDMLEKKGMSMADIDGIVLSGGATKMSQVSKRLQAEYGKPLYFNEPDKIVARGAALIAANLVKEYRK